jgi:hypothetical protein
MATNEPSYYFVLDKSKYDRYSDKREKGKWYKVGIVNTYNELIKKYPGIEED